MSETTTTPNYGLIKPNVNADSDLWGDHLNSNADVIDTQLKLVSNKSGVVTWNARSGAVSLTQSDVTTVLPPSAATPAMDGTASAGTNMTWSKSDHVHPTDTTRYSVTNPAGYVTAAQAGTAAPVQSVATRTGAVVLTHNDLTDWTATLAPYAPLASPALTGSPTAPTVTPTTDASTKLATTAFVQSALGAVPGGAIVSATPPAANPGALWFDSVGGQTYCRYDDGNTQQWVPVSNITGLANAAQLSDVAPAYGNVGRNVIHNGLFNINQRGAGPFTINGAYTLDRWRVSVNTDTYSVSQGAIADSGRAAIGDEAATYGYACTFTGTATATAFTVLWQAVEDVRRLAGKTVIVSFWAIAGVALKIGVSFDQVFGSGGSPSATVQSSGQSVTASTAWARYSLTFTLPSVAGKTFGTNNDNATDLFFWFSASTNQATRSGNVGVQSGSITLWGVQCEVAAPGQTQPTPLEKPDPELQLRQCQRFYQSTNVSLRSNAPSAGAIYDTAVAFARMRATPTAALLQAGGRSAVSGPLLSPNSPQSGRFEFSSTAGGDVYAINDNWSLSADL